jgi:hypothetical protein
MIPSNVAIEQLPSISLYSSPMWNAFTQLPADGNTDAATSQDTWTRRMASAS